MVAQDNALSYTHPAWLTAFALECLEYENEGPEGLDKVGLKPPF
jgi:hypothetical protein